MLVQFQQEEGQFSSTSVLAPTEGCCICSKYTARHTEILEIQREDTEGLTDAYLFRTKQANMVA